MWVARNDSGEYRLFYGTAKPAKAYGLPPEFEGKFYPQEDDPRWQEYSAEFWEQNSGNVVLLSGEMVEIVITRK